MKQHPFLIFSLWIFINIPLLGQNARLFHENIYLPRSDKDAFIGVLDQKYPSAKLEASSFRQTHFIQSPGGVHYTFQQYFENIPILDAGFKANMDHYGTLRTLISTVPAFIPESKVSHLISHTEAERVVLAEYPAADSIQIQPYWLLENQDLIPIFLATMHQYPDGISLEYQIHGVSGKILQKEDRGAHFSFQDTTGKGLVFVPDPCTKNQTPYGDAFIDANDADDSVLTSLLDTVDLRDITYQNGIFILEGPFVKVEDIGSFFLAPATSYDGNFFYTRSDDRFEDVMAYYHIDTYQRYVQSLGFTNLQNRPFRIDPHGKGDSDQSVFVPNGDLSYILMGDGGVDDAEDADVIIHEYGHALSFDAARDTRKGLERNGLDEGIGDYLAASYSFDLSEWNWFEVFNWDGHNEFWNGRMAVLSEAYDSTQTYNIWELGSFWSSAMMNIRQDIGPIQADRIMFQEMYSNFQNMTLEQAIWLLIDADTLLYNGAHTNIILDRFCQVGLIVTPSCLGVSVDREREESWLVYPNPAKDFIKIELPESFWNMEGEIIMTNHIGQKVLSSTFSNTSSMEISFTLPPGLYFISIGGNRGKKFFKKINIE